MRQGRRGTADQLRSRQPTDRPTDRPIPSPPRTPNQVRLPLSQGPGTLPLGSFEFPFSFALPRGLPGSTRIDNIDARGRIEYRVTARLAQSGLLIPPRHRLRWTRARISSPPSQA